MKYKDLKRYLLLSDGNQIDQHYTKVDEEDTKEIDGELYIAVKGEVLDGKAYPYMGFIRVIYTCQTEKCLRKHIQLLRDGAGTYFDSIKQCIADINASCEYHISKEKALNPKADESCFVAYYRGMHHAMEELKRLMSHQITWSTQGIEYFGQGGHIKEQQWFDSPLLQHKESIYW